MWPVVVALNDCEQNMDEICFLYGLLYMVRLSFYNHCEKQV